MGQIKKSLGGGSFGRIKPKQWSSIMAQLVEEGRIAKQGERRGTRYALCGDNQDESFPVPVEALTDDGPMGNYYVDDDLDHLEEFSNDPEVVESVKAEFADIIADAEPVILDEEVIMVDFIDDGPRREAPHLDVCCACDNASQFEQLTVVGDRHFCTEKCFAEYTGLTVYEEGYYGLGQAKIPAPEPVAEPTRTPTSLSVSAVMNGEQPNNPTKED